MKRRKGFTLIELMVVILIVGILASVAVQLMRGRIDSAKWSEANAAAGTIRTAVRAYAAEKGVDEAEKLKGKNLGDKSVREKLGFYAEDLDGTYFVAKDYTISKVSDEGIAEIQVKASQSNAPSGTKTLKLDGSWE